ncbi:hypothetical protein GCM10007036_25370 [Alsobacter metallidurans]|uniref:YARHG domain-containing protein n=1 Tax=Alsobacter metallidurans TaxID=340221 RepID=A0A917I8Z7_9HYPH|nr:hypothetical protein [Alsobacter metallidurans]GGH21240.1 hypothetical protein GCM10007036_25370 [Alsobacter metallidurans]
MRSALLAVAFSLAASTIALAGASSSNFGEPQPDPKTAKMTRYEAKLWVFDGCLISQSRLQGTTREAVHSPCSCYSTKTIDQMTKAEFEFFKAKSYFDDSSREKGYRNLDACKLKRPS